MPAGAPITRGAVPPPIPGCTSNVRHHAIARVRCFECTPKSPGSSGDLDATDVSLSVVVSGYDVVAAQTVHARKLYDHPDIRFGHRYVDVLTVSEDGKVRIDYGRFHDTFEE